MIKSILLIFILLVSLYFGTGGFITLQNDQLYEKAITLEKKEVIYGGVTFHNKEVMESAIQQGLIIKFYPYARGIPSILSFIITAISFGIIGSIGKLINDTIQENVKLKEADNLFLVPLQGGIIGLIILGISFAIPMILTNDNESLKPITIVFLSLFGGIFYLDFYKWFSKAIDKIVSKRQQ